MTRIRSTGNAQNIPEQLWQSSFMKACRGEAASPAPVWLMRQAGRYMQEYRDIRANYTFLGLCKDPDAASQVTVDAQRIIGADAAIIFADILLILESLGMGLTFGAGEGPKLSPTIANAADVAALSDGATAADGCSYVYDAIRQCRADLPADIPLIGFCGAPFTLASYACEGGGSKQYTATKTFMYTQTDAWHQLMEKIVAGLQKYLCGQVAAGAQVLQIFDSWVGCVNVDDYQEFLLPHMKKLIQGLPQGIPVILFGTHTRHLLHLFKETECDVIGIDASCNIGETWDALGGPDEISVQGNLDPGLLLASSERRNAATQKILDQCAGKNGFIFNLGHGIFKETDPQAVIDLIAYVHEHS